LSENAPRNVKLRGAFVFGGRASQQRHLSYIARGNCRNMLAAILDYVDLQFAQG
jgi:hypothetical protein